MPATATPPPQEPGTPTGSPPEADETSRVVLAEITPDLADAVRALRVAAGQERFVSTVAESLAEAEESPEAKPWPRALLLDGEPVGFVMLGWDVEPVDGLHGPYFLWKLLVDERHQRRGLGRAAVEVVCRDVVAAGGRELITSCVPGEGSPQPFYEGLGFAPTGERDDGEVVLRLRLDPTTEHARTRST